MEQTKHTHIRITTCMLRSIANTRETTIWHWYKTLKGTACVYVIVLHCVLLHTHLLPCVCNPDHMMVDSICDCVNVSVCMYVMICYSRQMDWLHLYWPCAQIEWMYFFFLYVFFPFWLFPYIRSFSSHGTPAIVLVLWNIYTSRMGVSQTREN